jgi:hypothetical protein
MVVVPCANSDPQAFAHASEFDPERWRHYHGYGKHPATPAAASEADGVRGGGGPIVVGSDGVPWADSCRRGSSSGSGDGGSRDSGSRPSAAPPTKQTNKHTMFTFGVGPRACVGQHIMRPLIQALATTIIEGFDWNISHDVSSPDRVGRNEPVTSSRPVKWLPIMRPVDPVSVVFVARDRLSTPTTTTTTATAATTTPTASSSDVGCATADDSSLVGDAAQGYEAAAAAPAQSARFRFAQTSEL